MKKEIVTPRGTFVYRSYGTVGNPTLILVHGWPQNSYCWTEIAQHLPAYHIIAPDLRGLGDSERTLAIDAYSKDQLGLDIFAIAAALNIDELNLGVNYIDFNSFTPDAIRAWDSLVDHTIQEMGI